MPWSHHLSIGHNLDHQGNDVSQEMEGLQKYYLFIKHFDWIDNNKMTNRWSMSSIISKAAVSP